MQMLFQACQTLYNSQSLWTDDTVCLLYTQSLTSLSRDSFLHPVLTVIDCMISISSCQVLLQYCCYTCNTVRFKVITGSIEAHKGSAAG